jgi:hypothetical protein
MKKTFIEKLESVPDWIAYTFLTLGSISFLFLAMFVIYVFALYPYAIVLIPITFVAIGLYVYNRE